LKTFCEEPIKRRMQRKRKKIKKIRRKMKKSKKILKKGLEIKKLKKRSKKEKNDPKVRSPSFIYYIALHSGSFAERG